MLNLLGALVLTYWMSRAFLYLAKGRNRNVATLALAHFASLAIAGLLLFWKTDTAMLPWTYVVSQGLWLSSDIFRVRRGIA